MIDYIYNKTLVDQMGQLQHALDRIDEIFYSLLNQDQKIQTSLE